MAWIHGYMLGIVWLLLAQRFLFILSINFAQEWLFTCAHSYSALEGLPEEGIPIPVHLHKCMLVHVPCVALEVCTHTVSLYTTRNCVVVRDVHTCRYVLYLGICVLLAQGFTNY